MIAIGYARVSTDAQGERGLGMDAQREAIRNACATRGWTLKTIHTDVKGGLDANGRQGLSNALGEVDTGQAQALIVARLDRLARSVFDGSEILRRAQKNKWHLVVADLGLDTTTPMGQFGAHILLAAAELERAMISERTKDALAALKARGVKLGQPPGNYLVPQETRELIWHLRKSGKSLQAIAREVNSRDLRTAKGKRWTADSVRKVVWQFIRDSDEKVVL
jgi:DNA invertase Pin-like site-specific DNA recombinase